jgi:flagellar motor switch protein FliG
MRRRLFPFDVKSYSTQLQKLLEQVDAESLAVLIKAEHPQSIAMILLHMKPAPAAKLLRLLPAPIQTEVTYRMTKIETVNDDVLEDLIEFVTQGLSAEQQIKLGGIEKAAKILAEQDPEWAKKTLEEIQTREPDLASGISEAMFTFEDLSKQDEKILSKLLTEIPTNEFVLALKLASEDMRERFFRCVSERKAQEIREELALESRKILKKDALAAQKAILEKSKKHFS